MGNENKNDVLIDKLVKLELEEKSVLRNLNTYYCDDKTRNRLFAKLKKIKKEIKEVKFKLRVEREIRKNEK